MKINGKKELALVASGVILGAAFAAPAATAALTAQQSSQKIFVDGRQVQIEAYRGFLALYAHYLYVLGKIEKHEYPPRMTAQMRESVVRFEQYREQFALMRENGITTKSEMDAFTARAEETIAALKKQRTILNVRKKRRKALYDALVDAEALSPARACYENGVAGLENELELCMEAEETLNHCGILREQLAEEKAALYEEIAEVNRAIRAEKKKLRLCGDITDALPGIERDLDTRPPWLS